MKTVIVAFVLFSFMFTGIAWCQDKTQTEDIKHSLRFTGSDGEREFILDNLNGNIEVTAYDGETVEVIAHRTIDAEDDEKLSEAKAEVPLEVKEDKQRVILYVDAPWRTRDGGTNYRGYRHYGYRVTYDFEVKVPAKCNFYVKTVNDGDILVKGLEGDFEVENVNGNVELVDVAGAGKATTVNGSVRVSFRKNPTGKSAFTTVNGKVEVEFQDNLAADLRLKTFNGKVYSDFDVEGLPNRMEKASRKNRRTIYRSGDVSHARVGSGGPELYFDSLNGNIYILKYENK